MTTCDICVNVTKKALVKCIACEFEACSGCHKTYLLDVADPQCMSCKVAWPRSFLVSNFSKTFVESALKKHRADVLFDLEIARLHEDQEDARAVRVRKEKLLKYKEHVAMYNELNNKGMALNLLASTLQKSPRERFNACECYHLQSCRHWGTDRPPTSRGCNWMCRYCPMHATLRAFQVVSEDLGNPPMESAGDIIAYARDNRRSFKQVARDVHKRRIEVGKLKKRAFDDMKDKTPTEQPVRRVFQCRCPVEECKGSVYASKCGLCDVSVCVRCEEVKEEMHECDMETVETVQCMKKDTRPCPKCHVLIYKIHGCDQMFCTQCHVGFSWKTGNLHTRGAFHNPHYFDWLSTRPDTRGFTDNSFLEYVRTVINKFDSDDIMRGVRTDTTQNVHAIVQEMFRVAEEYEGARLPAEIDNKDLRIKYLNDEIKEKTFRITLTSREKSYSFQREMYHLKSSMRDVICTELENLVDALKKTDRMDLASRTYAMTFDVILRAQWHLLETVTGLARSYDRDRRQGLLLLPLTVFEIM